MTTNQLLELASERHRAGEFGEALVFIDQAIALSPAEIRHQFGRGQVLARLGRHEEATVAYRSVLEAEPQLAEVHYALGLARQALGDLPQATAAYLAAVEHRPEFGDALNNLGNCYRLQGRLAPAEAAYRRALDVRPGDAGALGNLGSLLAATGRAGDAIALLQEAVRLAPAAPQHLINLGVALCGQRRFADAIGPLQQASALDRRIPESAYNLGNALLGLGRASEAAVQFREAVRLKADYADAYANLGNALRELGDIPSSLEAYAAAMKIDPGCAAAFNNAAGLHRRLGRMDEAAAVLRQSLAADPDLPATHSNLGNVLKDSGELPEAIACFRKALELDPADALAHSNLAYTLTFAESDGRAILDECRRWDARHGAPLRPLIRRHDNDRSPERRLRVGYVSGDFRDHCQSLFTLPLFSNHDHAALEIFCYSSVERPDDHTRRIESQADGWRNVRHLDDGELSEVIRRDRIDILVDLEMHMANGRPLLFARQPAPVQVAWLAYPGTTGLRAIDAVFTDPRLAPPGSDHEYSERVVRLPDTFWCYDPLAKDPPSVNALPALAQGPVTLGCLNAPCKITDRTIELWGQVMHRLENSRLLIMAPDGSRRRRLLDRLAAQGIASDRVTIQPFLPRSEYLRAYHRIDLALDTLPYNGHTTSLDAFWMGVPVVSRVGQTAVGRAGLSQLHNLSLTELAADTDEDFVEAAVTLAKDLPRLAALRRELRGRMERSPLMDGRRFAGNIERSYRELWRAWCGQASSETSG